MFLFTFTLCLSSFCSLVSLHHFYLDIFKKKMPKAKLKIFLVLIKFKSEENIILLIEETIFAVTYQISFI